MWPIQECYREWNKDEKKYTYAKLSQMAEKAEPFVAKIDLDDQMFFTPGNMAGKISSYLTKTGQKTVTDKGQIVRIILESLSANHCTIIRQLEELISEKINVVHVVGGGSQNTLFCQLLADAFGCKIISGPVEASSLGNIIVQSITANQIKNVGEGREIIRKSFELCEYHPTKS